MFFCWGALLDLHGVWTAYQAHVLREAQGATDSVSTIRWAIGWQLALSASQPETRFLPALLGTAATTIRSHTPSNREAKVTQYREPLAQHNHLLALGTSTGHLQPCMSPKRPVPWSHHE
jgi:hypothetical protein